MKPPTRATEPDLLRAAAEESLRRRLTLQPWRVVHTPPADGASNMAVDVALLEAAAREESPPILRFYAWDPPAVSLGRFQRADGIDLEYARRRGWDVVRRPTGGRAVLHQHELTYSIVLPPSVLGGTGVRTSYAVLTGGLNAGLRQLLTDLRILSAGHAGGDARAPRVHQPNCFALPAECDTLLPEGKLVGSAQVRRDGAMLQHGSILLDAEPEAWEALFGTAGRLVTLRQLLGAAPALDSVAAAVVSGFRELGTQVVPDARRAY